MNGRPRSLISSPQKSKPPAVPFDSTAKFSAWTFKQEGIAAAQSALAQQTAGRTVGLKRPILPARKDDHRMNVNPTQRDLLSLRERIKVRAKSKLRQPTSLSTAWNRHHRVVRIPSEPAGRPRLIFPRFLPQIMPNEDPIFFKTPAEFRAWLKKYHRACSQQWVGFHRKSSNLPSITWPESVDQALCFGWIDGLRKGVDAQSYKIRFTPRRQGSVWSAINTRRIKQLIADGQVQPAGLKAYARRTAARSGIYSYENRKRAKLSAAAERKFRGHPKAWRWFQQQAPSYQTMSTWWVVSAKRPETRKKRLAKLIADSGAQQKIGPLRAR